MIPICRYLQVVNTLLFVPGSYTVVVTNHRRRTFEDIMDLIGPTKGMDITKGPEIVRYGQNSLRITTINDMHDAYRFAGCNINLLCIDMFMPYEVEMYMKYRVRNLKLPNGATFKGTMVELD